MARILALVVGFGCLFLLAVLNAVAVAQQTAASEASTTSETPAKAEGEVQPAAPPELSPQMAALRDSVRRALARVAKQALNTRDSTPGDMIQFCLAFGCDAQIGYGSRSGKRINAIGALCWGYPCAGYRLLAASDGQVMARLGYGLQARPSQFLAVLAQSRVPIDYEIRLGEFRGTVADLIRFEKRNCRSGTDLSATLIGLSHYVKDGQSWQNDLGETWSVDRLLREELARPTSNATSDVTNRLMGLSYAIDRRKRQGQSPDEVLLRAQEHIGEFQDFALGAQNSDGSWHPSFFAHKGTSSDAAGVLRSTGHILEWLVFSLPEDRLEDPRVIQSVSYIANVLGRRRSGWNVASMSARDIGAVMHAAHALSIYDRRVFKPRSPETPSEEAPEVVASRKVPQ